jgi:hypothetical protein
MINYQFHTNLKFGTGFDFILDDYNKVGLNVEFSKLLVPTPQVGYNGSNYTGTDVNNDGVIDNTDFDLATQEYKSIGWVSGIFKSFGDAQKALRKMGGYLCRWGRIFVSRFIRTASRIFS